MTTIIPAALSALRRVAPAAVVASALVFGSSPIAQAIPESTIKSECAQANGTYNTTTDGHGHQYSSCCYKDIDGQKHCDYYQDGNYTISDINTNGPTQPSTRPLPPVLAPPPTEVNPGDVG